MKLSELTFATPAENLAADEALLDLCEETGAETLRFWESAETFVVVGYGNHVAREVNVAECRRRGVPILRRCSGGGTVVQGPGCLNYNLTFRIPEAGPLATVTGTNRSVMESNRAAFEALLGTPVSVQGHTDLAFREVESWELKTENKKPSPALNSPPSTLNSSWLKFSGNAQRRRRRALVFHGTILHRFDLTLIDALLHFPTAQPDYRADRGHTEFVRNLPVEEVEAIREHLRRAWPTHTPGPALPREQVELLLREHYQNDAWNFSR